jgi:hypothetical protein
MSVAVRFTSVAAFVPVGIILALRQPTPLGRIGYLFLPCALFGLAGVMIAMIVDYLFFGFWTIPFLGNFHFNVVLDYADLFGSHAWHWYFTAGLPAISGLLLPFLLVDLSKFLWGKADLVAQQRLWAITLSYLFIMSFNAHKEFRYILPVLRSCVFWQHLRSADSFMDEVKLPTRYGWFLSVYFGVLQT